jgi:type IV secretion system protein VirB9
MRVATNLTILTNRRHYQIEYTASVRRAAPQDDVLYALRFIYPASPEADTARADAQRVDADLQPGAAGRPNNIDYWYCGEPGLKPTAALDDGVHTRLTFAANGELPAVFVRNDDDSESLLNFSMDAGDVVIHRVARRYVLRRGKLTGCIVNQGYRGSGVRLDSGTVAPRVERRVQGMTP